MVPYVCERTVVRISNGREGRIISVDRENRIVVVKCDKVFCTEKLENIVVISYREIQ